MKRRRSPDDGPPTTIVEPKLDGDAALRYELPVRCSDRPKSRLLIIRHYDDGEVLCWIDGPDLPLGGL